MNTAIPKEVLLTATPLQNSILELYGLVGLLDPYCAISQIDTGSIAQFTNEIRASDRVKQFVKDFDDIAILEHYNLTQNNTLTNLGVLWLGTPQMRSRLVYPVTVQYLVYDELDKKVRKEEWLDYTQDPKELILDIEQKAVELTYFDELPQGFFRNKIPHYIKDL